MRDILRLPIDDESSVGEARRLICAMCRALKFTEILINKVAIIVNELGTNITKHTVGGEIFVRAIECRDITGIEILALDKGPGIKNLNLAMKDGYSTKNTLGGGLGAIKRLSSQFDIYTNPKGTAILSRVWLDKLPKNIPERNFEFGIISFPKDGEDVNGDGFYIEQEKGRTVILVVDGIGHGLYAAEAAFEAIRIFKKNWKGKPGKIVEEIHKGLNHTRGAVAAVAEINCEKKEVIYCGTGNIVAASVSYNGRKNMVSLDGTLGGEVRKIQEFKYSWENDFLFVIHTDGVSSRWDLNSYIGLEFKHPSIIAGIIFRDFEKKLDDATIIVGKHTGQCY